MLSRFFGKSDKSDESRTKEAQDKRGANSAAEDPNKAWRAWGDALAAQNADKPIPLEQSPHSAAPVPSPVTNRVIAAQEPELDIDLRTENSPLEPLTLEQRKNNALDTVDKHHQRIANTIRTLWGYKECGVYINKLIMAGGDGMGHARVGFNQEAVQAMLELSDLHDAAFGPPESAAGGLGLSI